MKTEIKTIDLKWYDEDKIFYAPFGDDQITHKLSFKVDSETNKFIEGTEQIKPYARPPKRICLYCSLRFGEIICNTNQERKAEHTHQINYIVQNGEIKSYSINKIQD